MLVVVFDQKYKRNPLNCLKNFKLTLWPHNFWGFRLKCLCKYECIEPKYMQFIKIDSIVCISGLTVNKVPYFFYRFSLFMKANFIGMSFVPNHRGAFDLFLTNIWIKTVYHFFSCLTGFGFCCFKIGVDFHCFKRHFLVDLY